ncbi:MAG: adenylate/guanylate cyclase domain-containing protein [Bacteroidota bacterium]
MKAPTTYCLLLLLILLPVWLGAQIDDLEFKVYGFEDGLSHRNVFKIQQAPDGYLWIATISGLNRFDGGTFLNYSSQSPDLPLLDDYLTDMLIDSLGKLWLAHPRGLTVFDPAAQRTRHLETVRAPHGLLELGVDQLYLSRYDEGDGSSRVLRFRGDSLSELERLGGTYAKRVFLPLDNGHLLVNGQENELWEIDRDGHPLRGFPLQNRERRSRNYAWVCDVQKTKDGTIWALLTDGQLFFKPASASEFQAHPIGRSSFGRSLMQSLLVEDNGDLWLGGIGVLWYYRAATGQLVDLHERIRELTKNTCTIRQIFCDGTGVLWIASDFGLLKVRKSDRVFTQYLSERNEYCENQFCSMRGICGDDNGNIYFSYYNSIHVLNTFEDELHPLFPQNNFTNAPYGLLYHRNALWTGNGCRIDLLTGRVDSLLPLDELTDKGVVVADDDDRLWFAYLNRLYRYDDRQKILLPYEPAFPPEVDISYLHLGRHTGTLWVGTNAHGLYALNRQRRLDRHWINEDERAPLAHNRIIAIYEGEGGQLQLATAKGLQILDPESGDSRIYRVEEGLPNNFVNGLLPEGDSAIWVSTDNGLARLDLAQQEFDGYQVEDGLSANEFNRISFYRSARGRMFFGGLNGVNAFYPNDPALRQRKSQSGQLLFTAFSYLDGRRDTVVSRTMGLSDQKAIELHHKDRLLTFSFALANYENPNENRYSYLLEGYDKEWSTPSRDNVVRFNDVPPNRYVFRVRSASGAGPWAEEELSIPLVIREAYYKTWWFLLLCGLALLSLWYAILRYRIYTLRRREKQLEAEVGLRTRELIREKQKSDDLLLNILPAETAEELKKFGKAQAKRHDKVTIFFSDFQDFTHLAQQMSPEELVAEIDHCFSAFDAIIDKYGLEKIKTIGDAYMCAGGLRTAGVSQSVDVLRAALEIQDFLERLAEQRKGEGRPAFRARIGIHLGPVITGIVGTKKFAYDMWGSTVNIAARLEELGEVGKVNVSENVYREVGSAFHCTHRGQLAAKNAGAIDMFFVEGPREEA